ncbi:MAG TPA: methylamine utilization protein MauG [Sulfurovum sp.]|nr:methylamine utilization protein MauG [Sulfurovum sp.]
MKSKKIIYISMLATLFLIGCGGSSNKQTIKFDTKEKLGESLFFDQNLSLNRKTSCATCHDPKHAFIDARFLKEDDQSVFINGAFSVGDDGSALGGRNAPTAAYAMFNPTFGKNAKGEYVGGQFHDGRAATLKDQAMGPPLDTAEMMMPNKQSVVERIEENPEYITAFKKLYGENIFDDINASYEAMGEAIAKFEKTEEFAPFDSKYDRFVKGEYTFTKEESLGYALFFSNNNTNCATCHTLNSKSEAISKEMFTNFKYENIGTPRNKEAMDARVALGFQDANATFKGLGGFVKNTDTDWEAHLGKSKVPTLRNVAVTGPYMSNGMFKELRTVIEFYDHMAGLGHHVNPETGKAWGKNDHNTTINHKLLKETKALTDDKIKGLEAFLRTLTDKRYEHLMPAFNP